MPPLEKTTRVFQELATCYDNVGEAQVRDRFLVLAADAALATGRIEEGEAIRQQLLQRNPHHLLKPYSSLVQAMESHDVKSYVEGLRRTYPRENAEQMLEAIRAGGQLPGVKLPAAVGTPSKSAPAVPATRPTPSALTPAPKKPTSGVHIPNAPASGGSSPPLTPPSGRTGDSSSSAAPAVEPAPTPRTVEPPAPSSRPSAAPPTASRPVAPAIGFAAGDGKGEANAKPPAEANETAAPTSPEPTFAFAPESEPFAPPMSAAPPAATRRADDEGTSLVATLLLLLMLAAGIALAVWTFAKPFWRE